MAKEVYHSSTFGEIPLSFTGRRLLANLREAIVEYVDKKLQEQATGYLAPDAWTAVSIARGRIAEYMSKLEERQLGLPKGWLDKYRVNVNSAFGKMPTMTPSGPTYQLPEIPEGYVFRKVGDVMSIEPMSTKQWNDIAGAKVEQPGQPKQSFRENEGDRIDDSVLIAEDRRRRDRNEKFRTLLNGYSAALTTSSHESDSAADERSATARQFDIDIARRALFDFIEKMP